MAGRKGKAPAHQWYPGDALSDEAMTKMTLEEEGAYRRLLDHHYREGSLPADAEDLRRLCKWIPARRFAAIWARIGKCFQADPADATRLINARAVEQRKELNTYLERAANGGHATAAALTDEQRSANARKAAKTRHETARKRAESAQESAQQSSESGAHDERAAARTASASASSDLPPPPPPARAEEPVIGYGAEDFSKDWWSHVQCAPGDAHQVGALLDLLTKAAAARGTGVQALARHVLPHVRALIDRRMQEGARRLTPTAGVIADEAGGNKTFNRLLDWADGKREFLGESATETGRKKPADNGKGQMPISKFGPDLVVHR